MSGVLKKINDHRYVSRVITKYEWSSFKDQDKSGLTPLMYLCANYDHFNLNLKDFRYITRYSDLKARTVLGLDALMYYIKYFNIRSLPNDNELMGILLSFSDLGRVERESGRNALIFAIELCDMSGGKLIISDANWEVLYKKSDVSYAMSRFRASSDKSSERILSKISSIVEARILNRDLNNVLVHTKNQCRI